MAVLRGCAGVRQESGEPGAATGLPDDDRCARAGAGDGGAGRTHEGAVLPRLRAPVDCAGLRTDCALALAMVHHLAISNNLPLGRIRISYNRSSGGHNGLESIIKEVKTEAFLRIRIGVAPETAKGNAKTPHGDEKIEEFILGPYKDDEMKELKKVTKKVVEAVLVLIKEGKEKAMSVYNAG